MATTKLFTVLEARGHKQRWLLDQLRARGHQFSETYLSQVKSGLKAPSRRFMDAVSETLGLPEQELFGSEASAAGRRRSREVAMPKAKRKGSINVAIIGVGNCASSLVQGVQFYQDARDDALVPRLMHVNLGGYHIRDINFVAAFDIDANKVGKDLSEAVFT